MHLSSLLETDNVDMKISKCGVPQMLTKYLDVNVWMKDVPKLGNYVSNLSGVGIF